MNCPKCDRFIPPSQVSLRELTATCSSCNHHFSFSKQVPGISKIDSTSPERVESEHQSRTRDLPGKSFTGPREDIEQDSLSPDGIPGGIRERDLFSLVSGFQPLIGLTVFFVIAILIGYTFFPKDLLQNAIQEKIKDVNSKQQKEKDKKESQECVEKRNQIWEEAKKEEKALSLDAYWKSDFEKILARHLVQKICPHGGTDYSIKTTGASSGTGMMFIFCPKHNDVVVSP